MKTNYFQKYLCGIVMILFCAAINLHAQGRGGGGFGGFGGFGGGARGGGGFGGGGGSAGTIQYNNNGAVGTANIHGGSGDA